MRKIYYVIVIVLVVLFFIIFRLGGEDSWRKNENGTYVKHGVPSNIPDYVKEQQEAIIGALQLYNEKKQEGMNFSSQCLGVVGNYAVDIVHVPRSEEDNLPENQCEEYKLGEVKNFIELDKDGNIFRIV